MFRLLSARNAYADYLDAEWDSYLAWRDSCRCSGCGRSILDRAEGEVWVTEELCIPCHTKMLDNQPKDGV